MTPDFSCIPTYKEAVLDATAAALQWWPSQIVQARVARFGLLLFCTGMGWKAGHSGSTWGVKRCTQCLRPSAQHVTGS